MNIGISTDIKMAKDYLPKGSNEALKQDEYIESLRERFSELKDKSRDYILYLLGKDKVQRKIADEDFYNHIMEMEEKRISIDDIDFPEEFSSLKKDDNLRIYIESFFDIPNLLNNNNLQRGFISNLARTSMQELFSVLKTYLEEYQEISKLKSFKILCKQNGRISVYLRHVAGIKRYDEDRYKDFSQIESDTPFIEFCKNIKGDDFDVAIEYMLYLFYSENYEKIKDDEEFIQACKTGYGYEIKNYLDEKIEITTAITFPY